MEETYIGYIGMTDCGDAKCQKNRNNLRKDQDTFYTTYADSVFTTHYDEIASRLTTRVNVSSYSGTMCLGVRALWDTGAVTTAISKTLAERLRLQSPVDTMITISATGKWESPCHYLVIQIANDIRFENVKVVEYPLENHDVDILLGMDIISKGRLTVNNENGNTVVEFELV